MATAASAATLASAPVNDPNAPAYIQFEPYVGNQVYINPGTWSGGDGPGMYHEAVQWSNDATGDIPGAVDFYYTVQSSDVGHTISVTYTVSNSSDSASTTVHPVGVVAVASATAPAPAPAPASNFAVVTPPSFLSSNIYTQGNTVSGVDPVFNKAASSQTYQWFYAVKGGSRIIIPGATSIDYPLTPSDVGSGMILQVNGISGSENVSTSSATSYTVTSGTGPPLSDTVINDNLPTLTGGYTVGDVVTVDPGTWLPSAGTTFTYQWQSFTLGTGALTGSLPGDASVNVKSLADVGTTHTLTSEDIGSKIGVTVTSHNGSIKSNRAFASTSVPVVLTTPPVVTAISNVTIPTLTGGHTVGDVMTVDPGVWLPSTGLTFTYYWGSFIAFGGSDLADVGTTHTLTTDDIGSNISVQVTASRGTERVSSVFVKTSNPVVAAVPPVVTVPPVVVPPVVTDPPVVVPPGATPAGTNPAPPAAPFATDAGFDATNAGTVTAVTSGNKATLSIPDAQPGDQVFIYGYSTPTRLGWYTVSPDRTVAVDYSSLPAGSHKLVAMNASGAVIGWAGVTVSGDTKLAYTGVSYQVPLVGGAAGAILMIGLLFAILARRASRLQLSTFVQPAKRRHRK